MDATEINNITNTQTTIIAEQQSQNEERPPKAVDEPKQPAPAKAEKPKQTYKCLVCGKSWVFYYFLRFLHSHNDLQSFFPHWIFCSRLKFIFHHVTPVGILIFCFDFRYSKKTSLFTHHKSHPEHCVHCGVNRGSSVENIYQHNLTHVNIRP